MTREQRMTIGKLFCLIMLCVALGAPAASAAQAWPDRPIKLIVSTF